MTTTLATIEAARNESFKAMNFNEVEAAFKAHITGGPSLRNYYTAEQAAELEDAAILGNQLAIEYALHTNDLQTAADAARDVLDESTTV